MVKVSISVNDAIYQQIVQLVHRGAFGSVSEAFAKGAENELKQLQMQEWLRKSEKMSKELSELARKRGNVKISWKKVRKEMDGEID